jgi:hypothetical protein
MKTKTFFTVSYFFFLSLTVLSQSPEAFNYQAVLRNEIGEILSNQGVDFKFYIYNGAPSNGILVYEEQHLAYTDTFGMVNLSVGFGTVLSSDSLKDIAWGNGAYYLEVRSDVNKDGNFVIMGDAQLLSVPYALYAKSSGTEQIDTGGASGAVGVTGAMGLTGSLGATGAMGVSGNQGTTGAPYGLAGSTGQTLYYNGADWTATDNLFNSGANIGVGTTQPKADLHVSDSIRVSRASDATGSQYVEIINSGAGGAYINGISKGSNKKTMTFQLLHDTIGSSAGAMDYIFKSGTLYSKSELMRITEEGKVGIGTANPEELLEVSSNLGAFIRFEDDGSHHFKIGTDNQNNYLDFRDGDGTDIMVVDGTNDRVGIGDETPDAKLHVRGSNARLRIESDNIGVNALTKDMFGLEMVTEGMNNTSSLYGTAIKFMSDDPNLTTESPKFLAGIIPRATETYAGDTDGGMAIDFATTDNNPGASSVPSVRMTIDDDGKVGIGTTAPEHGLDVPSVGGLIIGYTNIQVFNGNIDGGQHEFIDANDGYVQFVAPSNGNVIVTVDCPYSSGSVSVPPAPSVYLKLKNYNESIVYGGSRRTIIPYEDNMQYYLHAEWFLTGLNPGQSYHMYPTVMGVVTYLTHDIISGYLHIRAMTGPDVTQNIRVDQFN